MKARRPSLAEKFKIAEAIKANLEMFTQRRMTLRETTAELEKILPFTIPAVTVDQIKKELGISWQVRPAGGGKEGVKTASPKLQLFAKALLQIHHDGKMNGGTLSEIMTVAGIPQ